MKISLLALLLAPASLLAGNVIFIHPDGSGVSHWQAARFVQAGPDGDLNWDKLPNVAVYRGHMSDSLTATSNGGATTHAYGIKVPSSAFGTDGRGNGRPNSAAGVRGSLMHEALERGIRVGVVNSGSAIEPGTACFLTSVEKRDGYEDITAQLVESGADVILSGGEEWFLPEGVAGRHGPGKRKDGRNLVEEAKKRGYTLVFTRDELLAVPDGTRKLLGIFSVANTFNDMTEEAMKALDLPTYKPGTPTLAEMTRTALRLLGKDQFFLVVEEEGPDNFGNNNNAQGVIDALLRADEAFGVAAEFVAAHPKTLLITAADSEAGNMDVVGFVPSVEKIAIAKNRRDRNGAVYSLSRDGEPFLSAPDRAGVRHPFVISWGTLLDSSGGIVVRADGFHADRVHGSIDNTGIYSIMRAALFEDDVKR
ncbi:MAG: alkaline phosphatase [Terrimicrobiaceae bacterium]|nr:alkaline phosphatase [Terrimicrobiaceae bacterium]